MLRTGALRPPRHTLLARLEGREEQLALQSQQCPRCRSSVQASAAGVAALRCQQCRFRFCSRCKLIWHAKHDCDVAARLLESRRDRLASFEFEDFAAALGLKRCPGCGAPCEKADPSSCDHMTCLNCKKEFCWTCLADRSVIVHHGNHYHERDCKFYFAFDGPNEYVEECHQCKATGKACEPPRRKQVDSVAGTQGNSEDDAKCQLLVEMTGGPDQCG